MDYTKQLEAENEELRELLAKQQEKNIEQDKEHHEIKRRLNAFMPRWSPVYHGDDPEQRISDYKSAMFVYGWVANCLGDDCKLGKYVAYIVNSETKVYKNNLSDVKKIIEEQFAAELKINTSTVILNFKV